MAGLKVAVLVALMVDMMVVGSAACWVARKDY
jgi:hypothetical protein